MWLMNSFGRRLVVLTICQHEPVNHALKPETIPVISKIKIEYNPKFVGWAANGPVHQRMVVQMLR